jgi:hypothetical protein
MNIYGDSPTAIEWEQANNDREAFKLEAAKIEAAGGVQSPQNYNVRNSPGVKYLLQDGG